jgi:phage terminase Nu1 subunit (DNA packaging protein)
MGATLRKSHFAASIGVQRQRITELMKRGFPVRPDGWVDVDEATEWMRSNVSQQARFADRGIHKILAETAKPQKRAAKPPKPAHAIHVPETPAKPSHTPPDEALLGDGTGALPYAEAKALRETFLARKAKLDFEIQSGRLLAEDVVRREWSSILGNLKSALLAVPSRCGARLGHLTAGDIAGIDAEVRSVLAELGGGHVAR